MQKNVFFSKCFFPLRKIDVFEGRVAKLPNEHPPFVALRPPLRAIWTDVRSSYPWETPPRRHLDSPGNAKVFLGSTLREALGPRSPSGGLIWGGPMRGVSPLAPSEWPQDVPKRPQDTTPTIFGCKRAILQKCLFSFGKQRVFEGRVAKLRSEHPPFSL